MESSEASPGRISLLESDAVIEQARVEQWRRLVIIGPAGVLPSTGDPAW